MKKIILTLTLCAICAVSAFSQTISADSLYLAEAKDSLQVDAFVKSITYSSVYDVTEKIKDGVVVSKSNDNKIVVVEIYKDSIYFKYIPFLSVPTTFHEASFLRKNGHWYYYCTKAEKVWAFYGMSFIDKEIDDFHY